MKLDEIGVEVIGLVAGFGLSNIPLMVNAFFVLGSGGGSEVTTLGRYLDEAALAILCVADSARPTTNLRRLVNDYSLSTFSLLIATCSDFDVTTLSALMEESFFSSIKYPKIKDSKIADLTKPPSIKPKVACYDGKWEVEIYDTKCNLLFPAEEGSDLTPMDFVPKLSQVVCLIQCGGVWVVGSSWGIIWKLKQVVVKRSESLAPPPGKCLIDLSSEDREVLEQQEGETQDDDIPVSVPAPAPVAPAPAPAPAPALAPISTEVEDSDNEGEQEVPPTPAPVKKVVKKIVKKVTA
jgi:hypothetical protein